MYSAKNKDLYQRGREMSVRSLTKSTAEERDVTQARLSGS